MGSRRVLAVAALALTAALASCGQDNRYVAPPLPKVTVATPVQQSVTRYLEATGNMVAVNSADLVARVAGFIDQINYQDGIPVTKGTLLFTIEPEPYRVKLEQAQAAEVSAEAAFKQAQAAFERSQELMEKKVTTQALFDQALATREATRASHEQAKSNTRLAAINYEYAHVKAPFDGVVSARQVSAGQYVGGTATPTVLATIVQLDPIYVNFSVAEQDVQRIRAERAKQGLAPDTYRDIQIEVAMQSETDYLHIGALDYVSPSLSATTGTLAVRGIFKNEKLVLLPGYFVRVRVPGPPKEAALLVPDVAVGSDQGGRYVLIVNKEDVVEQRKVEIGQLTGAMRVIAKGIDPDDRVVTAGILRAVPGQKVDPQVQSAKAASQ